MTSLTSVDYQEERNHNIKLIKKSRTDTTEVVANYFLRQYTTHRFRAAACKGHSAGSTASYSSLGEGLSSRFQNFDESLAFELAACSHIIFLKVFYLTYQWETEKP